MSTTFLEEFDEFGNVTSVANIKFTDKVLGEGSFGTVRLAIRSSEIPLVHNIERSSSKDVDDSNNTNNNDVVEQKPSARRVNSSSNFASSFHSEGDIWSNTNFDPRSSAATTGSHDTWDNPNILNDNSLMLGNTIIGGCQGESNVLLSDTNDDDKEEDDQVVAVKIYSKFALKKRKEMSISRRREKRRVSFHDALEKVEKEIAIMKLINHPNLVRLYEVIDSIETATIYIVFEYVPLGQIMKFDSERMLFYQDSSQFRGLTKDGCYDEQHAALYFVDILHGLGFLHQHRICHCDLKPQNILVDARGLAKISDFGVSHLFEDEVDFDENTKCTGNLTKREGTYTFWSPEMCNGKSSSFSGYASDLWACGICLNILVSGKLPFYADDPSELFDLISKSETPHNDKISASLNSLIAHLLEKDPDERISVAEALKHPFCQQARAERMVAMGSEIMQSQVRDPMIKSVFSKSCTIQ